jgi:hypothetical protein
VWSRTHAATNQNLDIVARLEPMVALRLLGECAVWRGREGVVVGRGRGGGFGDVELCGRGGLRGQISVVVGVKRVLLLFERVHVFPWLSVSSPLVVWSVDGCAGVPTGLVNGTVIGEQLSTWVLSPSRHPAQGDKCPRSARTSLSNHPEPRLLLDVFGKSSTTVVILDSFLASRKKRGGPWTPFAIGKAGCDIGRRAGHDLEATLRLPYVYAITRSRLAPGIRYSGADHRWRSQIYLWGFHSTERYVSLSQTFKHRPHLPPRVRALHWVQTPTCPACLPFFPKRGDFRG